MTASACRRRPDCRLCGGTDLELALQLAPTPPANEFVRSPDVVQERFPLDVFTCLACGHAQLRDVVDPRRLFEQYVYVSGTSPVFVDHFRRYAEALSREVGLATGDLVVDVGSNDGTLLRFFADAGQRVQGVDPARAIAEEATRRGLPTEAAFFTPALAADLRARLGPARVVTANNVFAHVDDLGGVADGVRALLAPDGLFAFEVSYLVDVVEKTLFDTIYHEHVAYHAVKPLVPFLRAHGLELIDAVRVDTHGGSLRGVAQLAGGPRAVRPSVAAAVAHEEALGLDRPARLRAFGEDIERKGARLREVLAAERAAGRRVAGFGAPAKATTLMHHFRLGRDEVEFIVDDSPLKQGLYTPGLHVPVVSSSALAERRPDTLLILAWNFAGPIMAKQRAFAEAGGRFVVPLPEVEVH